MWHDIEAQICIAASGRYIMKIVRGEQVAYPPLALFAGSGTDGIRYLAHRGIAVVGKASTDQLLRKIASESERTPMRVADGVGWQGPSFVLGGSQVCSPEGGAALETVFADSRDRFARAGSMKGWRTGVSVPLTGQTVPIFAMCIAFMPPILALSTRVENVGFELVGAGGIGKSTVQRLMASVLGPPTSANGDSYIVTADSTLNALERVMADHADLPLIIEEASLFFAGESEGKRREAFKAVAFKLGAGSEKDRLSGERPRRPVRLAYLLSTNEALGSLLGKASDIALAAADRLISIPIDPGRPFGVFDFIPEGYASASAYADQLTNEAVSNHGRAFRRFLKRLVQARADDENGLREKIAKDVALFTRKVGANVNNGSEVRVAQAFALVYAAGRLAQAYGALPPGWKIGPAVKAVYLLHRSQATPTRPFLERLAAFSESSAVVPRGSKLAATIGRPNSNVSGVIDSANGGRLLYIPDRIMERAFSDWVRIKSDPGFRKALIVLEPGRLTVKRRLSKGGRTFRVYVFDMAQIVSTTV